MKKNENNKFKKSKRSDTKCFSIPFHQLMKFFKSFIILEVFDQRRKE